MAKKTTSKNKQEKYKNHPMKIKGNKIKRILKHIKKQPKDEQAQSDLVRVQAN